MSSYVDNNIENPPVEMIYFYHSWHRSLNYQYFYKWMIIELKMLPIHSLLIELAIESMML